MKIGPPPPPSAWHPASTVDSVGLDRQLIPQGAKVSILAIVKVDEKTSLLRG